MITRTLDKCRPHTLTLLYTHMPQGPLPSRVALYSPQNFDNFGQIYMHKPRHGRR